MVIDSNNIQSSGGGPRGRIDSAAPNSKSGSGSIEAKPDNPAKPEVSLSSQAQTLSRLESEINSAPSVNSDKVAEIQKAIADGTYEINAERIAQKMIEQDDLF